MNENFHRISIHFHHPKTLLIVVQELHVLSSCLQGLLSKSCLEYNRPVADLCQNHECTCNGLKDRTSMHREHFFLFLNSENTLFQCINIPSTCRYLTCVPSVHNYTTRTKRVVEQWVRLETSFGNKHWVHWASAHPCGQWSTLTYGWPGNKMDVM